MNDLIEVYTSYYERMYARWITGLIALSTTAAASIILTFINKG